MRMDPEGKKPRTVRRKAAGMGDNSAGDGYLDGQLLIAMPVMGDPRFERSVIYLCAHSSEGAMGIIVNRPAGSIDFPELLVQLDIIEKALAQKQGENYGTPAGSIMCTGAYMFKSWNPGVGVIAVRNPHYWNPSVHPLVDQITIKGVPDVSSFTSGMLTGFTGKIELPRLNTNRNRAPSARLATIPTCH